MNEPEKSWQLLKRIIPRGARSSIAYGLHVSEEWVSRWCREPQPGKHTRSPIDRTCQLIDEVLKHNRLGAVFIVEFIANHYRKRVQENQAPTFESTERREVAADLLRRGVEAVNSLNVEGATEPTLRELVELIEVAVQAKERVEKELAGRPTELSQNRLPVIIYALVWGGWTRGLAFVCVGIAVFFDVVEFIIKGSESKFLRRLFEGTGAPTESK